MSSATRAGGKHDLPGGAVFALSGLISIAGIALNLVYNCTLLNIVLILPACLIIALSFLASWRAGLLTTLLFVSTLSWSSVSFKGEWNYAAACFIAAAVAGAAIRYLLFGGRRRIGALSRCLLAVALLAAAAAPFAVWRYATFEPLPGAGYINQSISALGVGSNAVIANVLTMTMIYAAWAGIFLAAAHVKHKRVFLRDLRRMLPVIAALNAVAALLQLNWFPKLFTTAKWSAARQASGLMIDGNALGMFSALAICAAPLWLPRRTLRSPSALLALILFAFCIMAAGSRSALALVLVFAAVLAIALAVSKLRRGKLKEAVQRSAVAVSTVIVLLAGIFFIWQAAGLPQPPLLRRLAMSGESLLSGAGIDHFTNSRITMWGMAWGMASAHPLAGVGPGTYFCEVGNFAASQGVPFRMIDNAMNLYLHLFAELGIVALIAIVVFLALLIRGQWRRVAETGRARDIAILSFLLSLPVVFLIGPHIVIPEPMFAAMLFLGLIAGRNAKDDSGAKPRTFGWKGAAAWAALLAGAAAASYFTSAAIHPSQQWQRLRWHIEAGFGPQRQGDVPFKWSETLAVMTVKPEGRFLHLKCRAGDERAPAFRQRTDFFLAGRRIGGAEFSGPLWRDLFFRIEQPSPANERLVLVSNPPYIPDDYLGNGDRRRLGPAVAGVWAIDSLEEESYGFWPPENDGEREFRWSQREGYLRLERGDGALRFDVRAAHPDISEKPVVLLCEVNGAVSMRIELADGHWQAVEFSAEEIAGAFTWRGVTGVARDGFVRFVVDRTWVPAAFDGSEDNRELGVAVSRFTFVPEEER